MIKKLLCGLVLMVVSRAFCEMAIVDGVTWRYSLNSDGSVIIMGEPVVIDETWNVIPAVSKEFKGTLTVPTEIGGFLVRSIGSNAFFGCDGITSILIPSSVASIESGAFSGCAGLTAILVDSGNAKYSSIDGVLYHNISRSSMYVQLNGLELVRCPEGMVGGLTIPEGVVSISSSAFANCIGLTSVTIPASVEEIGGWYEKSRNPSYSMGSSLMLGGNPFDGCSGLVSIFVNEGNAHFLSENGILYLGEGGYFGEPIHAARVLTCPLGKTGCVTIPEGVTAIESSAFANCSGLTSVTIPSSMSGIGSYAFGGCAGLTSVTIPSSVTSIPYDAFEGCTGLADENGFIVFNGVLIRYIGSATAVSVPDGVTRIGDQAFYGCETVVSLQIPASVGAIGHQQFGNPFFSDNALERIVFKGNAPTVPVIESVSGLASRYPVFHGCERAVVYVPRRSVGWSDGFSMSLPSQWEGCSIVHSDEAMDWGAYLGIGQGPSGSVTVNLTVTNVVVNYVLNSVRPEIAVPATSDTGFVNIIAEVKGGVVSVPESWANNYPNFVSKFGSDFTKALAMKSGKRDGAGNEMLVWQDYVAGTDPTDEKDVFTASITIVDGKVTISYTPELDDERKAMRKYTTWGKTSLMDTDWTEVQEGREAEYNFFKVSVEMR